MPSTASTYEGDIDFGLLARQDPDFARILKPNGQLDFSNPASVQQLTTSLLKRDFRLNLSLPNDRLCPPVPNRLNYILWLQSILDTTSDSYTDQYDPQREVLGVDIGTGASCIYPLLGCSQRPTWKFIGTDIDEKSLEFATRNVEANGLQNRIQIRRMHARGPIIPKSDPEFDFTMCNPPFYSSQEEMLSSAASKQRPPFTACTGSANEMVTPGGEVQFVTQMIEESGALKEQVQWYSSMLGKFSSIAPVVEQLKQNGVDNWAVTEFVQGSRTRRWAVAWSFGDLRPGMSLSRAVGSLQKGCLPFPPEYQITLPSTQASEVGKMIDSILDKLPLKWMWKSSINTGLGFSQKAVWSRAFRRHVSQTSQNDVELEQSEEFEFVFGFKIQVEQSVEPPGTQVNIRWVKGRDSVIFESFCGMVKRKVEELSTEAART